jgi:serine protease
MCMNLSKKKIKHLNWTKTIFILILYFTAVFANAQSSTEKSYIIQLAKGVSLNPQNNLLHENDNRLYTARQVCDEPLNIWSLTLQDKSRSSPRNKPTIIKGILQLQENRKLTSRKIPNDSLYSKQWQYNNTGQGGGNVGADLSAENAWAITTGGVTALGDTIVVAIVDDGLDIKHEDIKDNLWINKLEIPNDNIDNDNNGYIDDVNGWNAGANNNNVSVNGGHGTQVTGIIGARGNNKIGVTGINWNVKLMPINYGSATEDNAIASYAYIYKMRKRYNISNGKEGAYVVVANSSWGIDNTKAEEAPLWCAMYDSLGSIGVLSVAATANANTNVDIAGDLPTSCTSEYLIAVTNINKFDTKQPNAAYGKKSIDIGAYGEDVFTIATNNRYRAFGGTSASSPQVAGAVALMYGVPCIKIAELSKSNPSIAALMIKDVILNQSKSNASLTDLTVTGNKLNLFTSVNSINNICQSCIKPAAIKVDFLQKNNAVISWYDKNNPVQIRYRKEGSNTWIQSSTVAPSTTLTIPNLEYCTSYEYQLLSCTDVSTDWTYTKYFITLGCCEAPNDVAVKINANGVEISEPSNTSILLEYKKASDTKWDTTYFKKSKLLTTLPPCQSYDYRVSKYCEVQKIYTLTSAIKQLYTSCGLCTNDTYCRPAKLKNNTEWIASVSLGKLTKKSNADANGFGNHVGTIIPSIKIGDTLPIKIVLGYSGDNYKEYTKVFVDWNQDTNYGATTELAFSTPQPKADSIAANIIIPKSAKIGLTRMRITMSYDAATDPCSTTAEYGEVEEYCINLRDTIVSTKDFLLDNLITLSPNPNNGSFDVNLSQDIKVSSYSIFNAIGVLLYHKNNIQEDFIHIDTKLIAGSYILRLKLQNGKVVNKMMVVQ